MDGDDFPTLPLAASLTDGAVRTGAELFIMGYPGELALDTAFSIPSRLEPSLTYGHVSGIKEMTEGDWKAIQTDASISPGNSGGPALNNVGQVVGLATFTIQGEHTQNLNFAISVDVVQEFLRDLDVTPSQSAFTTTYLQALDAYESGDRRQAMALLQGLSARHPESSIVRAKLRQFGGGQVQAVASPGPPRPAPTPTPSIVTVPPVQRKSGPVIFFFFVAGFLAAVLIVIVLTQLRRKRFQ
jgi:S1-C subfamily serine protease